MSPTTRTILVLRYAFVYNYMRIIHKYVTPIWDMHVLVRTQQYADLYAHKLTITAKSLYAIVNISVLYINSSCREDYYLPVI